MPIQLLQFRVSIPVWCDLEDAPSSGTLKKIKCFNSSMVRFGVGTGNTALTVADMFQFQYGAIWSSEATTSVTVSGVSIPVWCDLEQKQF